MYSLYTLVSYADGKCLASRSNLNRCLARIALQIGCKRHRSLTRGLSPCDLKCSEGAPFQNLALGQAPSGGGRSLFLAFDMFFIASPFWFLTLV